ncbi:MAG: zinc-ribbon domain-containing protein [Candidatus Thorarchaeota archaeon]
MTLDHAPNEKITALLTCPRHKIGHHLTLDHSALDLWATVVADHMFRCAVCGRELPPVPSVSSSEVATTFTLNCPVHGTRNNTRTVWSVVHRRLVSEIQQLRAQHTSLPHDEQTTPPARTPTTSDQKTSGDLSATPQFCPQCGHKIRTHDNFCYICGSAID